MTYSQPPTYTDYLLIYIYIYIYIHMYIYIYIYAHAHICVYMCIYICIDCMYIIISMYWDGSGIETWICWVVSKCTRCSCLNFLNGNTGFFIVETLKLLIWISLGDRRGATAAVSISYFPGDSSILLGWDAIPNGCVWTSGISFQPPCSWDHDKKIMCPLDFGRSFTPECSNSNGIGWVFPWNGARCLEPLCSAGNHCHLALFWPTWNGFV